MSKILGSLVLVTTLLAVGCGSSQPIVSEWSPTNTPDAVATARAQIEAEQATQATATAKFEQAVEDAVEAYIASLPTATPEPNATPVPLTATPTPVISTSTSVPPAPTTAPSSETFTYVPGGPNYAYPEDGAVEQVNDGWTRIRQAANGQYLAWTFFTRIHCDTAIGEKLQWDSATKLNVFGPINCRIELKRDLESSLTIDPDPYVVANAKNSPLGLGWFITGIGTVTVNRSTPVQLSGPGVKQLGFPGNWTGTWVIDLEVPANGLVVMNQGEKLVPDDNWPLP